MANTTFLDLPIATSLDGTEVFPIVQPPNSTAGVSKRATVAQVAALASTTTGSLAAFLMATAAFSAIFPGSRFLVTNPDFSSTDGGAGAAFTIGPIATAAVTYAKFQQVPGQSVLGVAGAATTIIAPITGTTAGHVLQVNAGGTGIGFSAISTAAFSGTVWTVPFGGTGHTSFPAFSVLLGNGTNAVSSSNIGSSGQLFIGQTSTSNPAFVTIVGDLGFSAAGTATIATAAVSFAKFQQVAGLSVVGVTGTATGVVGAITGSTGQFLQVNAGNTGLLFGPISLNVTTSFSGVLQVPSGGTGQSTYVIGDLLYASATNVLSKLAAGTAGWGVVSTGTGSSPTYTTFLRPSQNLADLQNITTSRLNLLGDIGLGSINASLALSIGTSALTIALKDGTGADASTASPVTLAFRNVTASLGTYTTLDITSALSFTVTSGSTLGFVALTPGRAWIVAFNDGGTPRIGAINCRATANIYPLSGFGIASSTAEGGAGGADTAQLFYTQTAVTSKAYIVLGYATWEAGLTTAGLWSSLPDRVQPFGAGVRLPGATIQTVQIADAVGFSTTSTSYVTSTLTGTITPSSATNPIMVVYAGNMSVGVAAQQGVVALNRGTTRVGGQRTFQSIEFVGMADTLIDTPNTTSGVVYNVKVRTSSTTSTVAFPWSATGEPPYGVMTMLELMG